MFLFPSSFCVLPAGRINSHPCWEPSSSSSFKPCKCKTLLDCENLWVWVSRNWGNIWQILYTGSPTIGFRGGGGAGILTWVTFQPCTLVMSLHEAWCSPYFAVHWKSYFTSPSFFLFLIHSCPNSSKLSISSFSAYLQVHSTTDDPSVR